MKKADDYELVKFLFEVGSLRKVVRAHQQEFFTSDPTDNISTHSFRVAIIGWFLAQQEKADTHKVLVMTLFHDIPETRSGDQNWVHKRYVKVFEEEIIKDQLKGLPGENELNEIIKEYSERKTKEAIVTKDADLIDQIMLLKEYEWQGNKEATIWLKSKEQHKRLKTKSAKNLAKIIDDSRPNDWTKNVWTAKRR